MTPGRLAATPEASARGHLRAGLRHAVGITPDRFHWTRPARRRQQALRFLRAHTRGRDRTTLWKKQPLALGTTADKWVKMEAHWEW